MILGAYALYADNTIADRVFSQERFDADTNEAILLQGAIVVPEVWVFNNPFLRNRLQAPDGVELLRERMVIPLRRDNTTSFEQAFGGLLAKGAYDVSESQRPFVQSLDRATPEAAIFALGPVMAAYREVSDVLFTMNAATALGVTPEGAEAFLQRVAAAKASGLDVYTNTFVHGLTHDQNPFLSVDDASRIWTAARAMYSFNIPTLLGLGVAAPDNYEGHRALAVLRKQMRSTASLGMRSTKDVISAAFKEALGDARVAWLFSRGVLTRLSAEDLLAATRVENYGIYHDARDAFLAQPMATTWSPFVVALRAYLTQAADEVLRLWTRRGVFGEDLKDAEVLLIGDAGLIRLATPGQPDLAMSGLAAAATSVTHDLPREELVQVVATHLEVPVSIAE